MKQMWAPWRMDYIKNVQQQGCFMCAAFADDHDEDNLIVQRGEHCAIIMNRYPYNNGHLMVSPYRHIANMEELSSEEQLEMMTLATRCVTLLKKIMCPHGFNIGINIGEVAGAGLKDHIHLHVVPRWSGDTNFMPVFGQTKVIPQDITDVWHLLQDAMKVD